MNQTILLIFAILAYTNGLHAIDAYEQKNYISMISYVMVFGLCSYILLAAFGVIRPF